MGAGMLLALFLLLQQQLMADDAAGAALLLMMIMLVLPQLTPPACRSGSFAAATARPSRAPSARKVPAAFACLHAVPIV